VRVAMANNGESPAYSCHPAAVRATYDLLYV